MAKISPKTLNLGTGENGNFPLGIFMFSFHFEFFLHGITLNQSRLASSIKELITGASHLAPFNCCMFNLHVCMQEHLLKIVHVLLPYFIDM